MVRYEIQMGFNFMWTGLLCLMLLPVFPSEGTGEIFFAYLFAGLNSEKILRRYINVQEGFKIILLSEIDGNGEHIHSIYQNILFWIIELVLTRCDLVVLNHLDATD